MKLVIFLSLFASIFLLQTVLSDSSEERTSVKNVYSNSIGGLTGRYNGLSSSMLGNQGKSEIAVRRQRGGVMGFLKGMFIAKMNFELTILRIMINDLLFWAEVPRILFSSRSGKMGAIKAAFIRRGLTPKAIFRSLMNAIKSRDKINWNITGKMASNRITGQPGYGQTSYVTTRMI